MVKRKSQTPLPNGQEMLAVCENVALPLELNEVGF